MIFSKTKIKELLASKALTITPFSDEHLREASYVLHLELPEGKRVLSPGQFISLMTVEKLTLSSSVACLVTTHGKAAQQGIDAVQSSLFCEPDTDNQIVLEISNTHTEPVTLLHGMNIAKAVFIAVE